MTDKPTSFEVTAMGLDPGLRHGCLVHVKLRFHSDRSCELLSHEVVYEWNHKSSLAIGVQATINDMIKLSDAIAKSATTKRAFGTYVAVDYDTSSVFWGTGRLQSVKMAFLMGLLTTGLRFRGFPLFFFTPSQVRQRLGLPKKADKNQTATFFSNLLAKLGQVVPDSMKEGKDGDRLDAFILAYLIASVVAYDAMGIT